MIRQKFFLLLIIGLILGSCAQKKSTLRVVEATDASENKLTLVADSNKTVPVQEISINKTPQINKTDKQLKVFEKSEIVVKNNIEILPSTKLQDNPELEEIDKRWMELIKKSDLYDTSSYNINDISLGDIIIEDLPTELLKKRLAILDAKTPFHVSYNADLEYLIKRYLKTRKKSLSNLMAKAKFYFPLFEEKLDKYDIPLEVKYLAIVESALQPKARSRVGATGLWQFMYQTGKQYGLQVSSYVDDRQDPVLATDAACRFLADLYNIFDDWDLALAAYNSGAGNVNKAIRRSGGNKNYWNIRSFLPRETANYLPIFYATLYLFEYAEEHNLQASDDFNLHYFEVDSVQVKRLITFEQIQTTTGIEEELLAFLNPAYKLDIVPHIKGKNYSLVLPREYIGLFVHNEASIYAYAAAEEAKREKPLPEYSELQQKIRYRVRSGDYLGKIAKKYGVSVNRIKRWNNLRSTKLRIGQRLTIYPRHVAANTKKKTTTTKKSKKKSSKKVVPKGSYVTYVVKEGDSLWSISQKYKNVSVSQIKDWNSIRGSKLSIGAKLKIFRG